MNEDLNREALTLLTEAQVYDLGQQVMRDTRERPCVETYGRGLSMLANLPPEEKRVTHELWMHVYDDKFNKIAESLVI